MPKYDFFEKEEMKSDEPEFLVSDLTISNPEPQTQIKNLFLEHFNMLNSTSFENHQPSLIKLLENKQITGISIDELNLTEHALFVSDRFYCEDDIQQLSGMGILLTNDISSRCAIQPVSFNKILYSKIYIWIRTENVD